MQRTRLAALLVGIGILVGVLGSVLVLAGSTLGLGGVAPPFVSAAMATVILLVVATLAAVVVGLRGGGNASTPYW